MSINDMPIDQALSTSHPHRWHVLADRTEAMATHDGVLVRFDVGGMVHLKGCVVLQRWRIEIVEPDDAEGIPERIVFSREIDIHPAHKAPDPRVTSVFVAGQPRWFHADEPMPRPTDEQIRDYAAGLAPADEITALTREVLRLHRALADAERGDEHHRLADAVSDYLDACGELPLMRVCDLPTEMQRLADAARAERDR